MTEISKTPDAVVARSKITKSMLGGDDVTIILSSVGGDEVARFGKFAELQIWLAQQGYVYLTDTRGVWIKAPKVPTKENEA